MSIPHSKSMNNFHGLRGFAVGSQLAATVTTFILLIFYLAAGGKMPPASWLLKDPVGIAITAFFLPFLVTGIALATESMGLALMPSADTTKKLPPLVEDEDSEDA